MELPVPNDAVDAVHRLVTASKQAGGHNIYSQRWKYHNR